MAIAAVGAVVAGSLAFWLAGRGDSGPQTTIVRNGEVWLQGEITQDTCAPSEAMPDRGCSITVNGYEVIVAPGNAALPPGGTVTGLDGSTDQTGSHADVYAQLVGPHSASILSAEVLRADLRLARCPPRPYVPFACPDRRSVAPGDDAGQAA